MREWKLRQMITVAITYAVGTLLFAIWMVFRMVFENPCTTITRGELLIASFFVLFWPITLPIQLCAIFWNARWGD